MKATTEKLTVSEGRPYWLKKRLVADYYKSSVSETLRNLNLHTVCQGALCPNISECFAKGTATFMILGDTCTRNCRFCAVNGGDPVPVDVSVPVAETVAVTEKVRDSVGVRVGDNVRLTVAVGEAVDVLVNVDVTDRVPV